MNTTKNRETIAILSGVLFALALVSITLTTAFLAYKTTRRNLQPSYFDREILPYIRTNLDTISQHNLGYEAKVDSPTEITTKFGQYVDKDYNIVLLGKTAMDFQVNTTDGNRDTILLNRMIRKLYINSSPEDILDIDRNTLKLYYHDDVYSDYIITGLQIKGLDTLEDRNSSEVMNELRFTILGFVKVYLGLINLSEVTVEDMTISENTYYSFTMSLPTGEEYGFKYFIIDPNSGIADIMVERK